MASEPDNIFSQITDEKPVRVFLPILNTDERLLLPCVLKQTEHNHFNLLFTPGTLAFHHIDKNISCLVSLDVAGQTVSIESKIIDVVNDQTLQLVHQKTINHEQMREYFRVDCTIPLLLKSLVPEEFGIPEEHWKIPGTTVDLSGSGLRASFTVKPPAETKVRLELALPTTETSIVKALASPVRITQLNEKLWDAAYQFDQIEDEDQDAIVGCCMAAQRRLLRLKIKVTKKEKEK